MSRYTVDVLNDDGHKHLKELEDAKEISIVDKAIQKNVNELSKDERLKKIQSLRGSLSHLSYEKVMKELEEMRNEWERTF